MVIQPFSGFEMEMPTTMGGMQSDDTFSDLPENPQVTITVPAPRTVAVPATPVDRAQEPAPATTAPVKVTPAKVAPAPAEKPASVAKETTKPATAKPVATKTPVETGKTETPKLSNNYWVQTGAFSTQVRAEGAKESLASKGITSVIDNRDIDGKTWYRVRVGPYLSETEANYWLALVKTIDGFADSQIRQTPALR
jgi:DedD protein